MCVTTAGGWVGVSGAGAVACAGKCAVNGAAIDDMNKGAEAVTGASPTSSSCANSCTDCGRLLGNSASAWSIACANGCDTDRSGMDSSFLRGSFTNRATDAVGALPVTAKYSTAPAP